MLGLKSDLRGIETKQINEALKNGNGLKSDLRGIETKQINEALKNGNVVKIRP